MESVQPHADPNALSVIRQEAHDTLLAQAGIAHTPGLFAPGLPLNESGERNRNTRRVAYENMAGFAEVGASVIERIQAEQRLDYVIQADMLRMHPDGYVYTIPFGGEGTYVTEHNRIPLERRGLYLLLSRLSPNVFSRSFDTLCRASPSARAVIFNDLMERRAKLLKGRKGQPKLLKLRSRLATPGAPRSVFAVVSDQYPTVYDGDHYLGDVITRVQALDPDTKGRVVYDPQSTRVWFEAIWNEDFSVDYGCGDVFRLALTGLTRDDAGSRYRLWAAAYREAGGQFFTFTSDKAQLIKRVHRGQAINVVDEIEESVERVMDIFSPFLAEWGVLRKTPIEGVALFGKVYDSVPAALAGLVESNRIDLGCADDALALQALLNAWGHEPGSSVADLLCAVSKAATDSVQDMSTAAALESQVATLTTKLCESVHPGPWMYVQAQE